MSEIEWYLDELFDQLAGTGAAGRRALMEAEYHLRATAADAMARGLPEDQAGHEAVSRFGPPALVARTLRSARPRAPQPGRVDGLAAGGPGGLRARRGLPGCGLVAQLADTELHHRPFLWLLHHRHACDAGHHGHDDRRCRCRVAVRPLARRQVRGTDIQSPRIRVAVAAMKQSRPKLASPLLSAAIRNGWAGVTRLCAWCENPIPARARRDAVCCSVRRCGGFKLNKRGRKGAAQLRPCAVDRG